MPPDASLTRPEADPVNAIDVRAIYIFPGDSQVIVELDYKRESGAVARTVTERFDIHAVGETLVDDFTPCVEAFCQSAPTKRLMRLIVERGRISGVTVNDTQALSDSGRSAVRASG